MRTWIKIGLLSFGGPTGQIALMHHELVEKNRWVSNGRFLHALNYCMLLPGPEAQQLAIYTGWLLHRTWGGIVAGVMFVWPGAVLMWGISMVYVYFGKVPLVEAIFYGLKVAVLAVVAGAVLRIGKKALCNRVLWVLAATSFVAIYFFAVPFPLIVVVAGLVGWMVGVFMPQGFGGGGHLVSADAVGSEDVVIGDGIGNASDGVTTLGTLGKAIFWLLLWLLPVFWCLAIWGPDSVLTQQGMFFSKAAVVTFGGAYAVLPYVAQQAVESHGWLTTAQMMDGLGLAETTPGPLILVLQFVGFLGGWSSGEGASPWVMATMAAALTSWVTFLPGFLFIFTGAPYIERSRGNKRLTAALSAVTAAVVGVVLNLAVWFGWTVILPEHGRVDWIAAGVAGVLFFALRRWNWDVLWVVGAGAGFGLLSWGISLG